MLVEDLIAEGNIGLIKAAKDFDNSLGAFKTYANRRIIGSMIDYLRSLDIMARGDRRLLKHSQRLREENPDITREEQASKLGLSVERLEELILMKEVDNVKGEEDEEYDLLDTLPSYWPTPYEILAKADSAKEVEYLLSLLRTRREVEAVKLRFFEDKTMAQIGEHFGVGESRASQLISNALITMRKRCYEDSNRVGHAIKFTKRSTEERKYLW